VQLVHGAVGAQPSPVLTIGNFDGVHVGHRALLALTRSLADTLQAPATALTFDPSPAEVLRSDRPLQRLQSLDHRLASLQEAGIDRVVLLPFTRALAALSPEAFTTQVLVGALGARGFALGHDFRFGAKRAGTADTLRRLVDVPVRQVDPVLIDGSPVSSTRIRAALAGGDVANAARLLGRAHCVGGRVVAGDQRGRTLGFPTANVAVTSGLLPANGVYAVHVIEGTDGAARPGVANLGNRPTFRTSGRTFEVHLLDFSGDLYDRTLNVSFAQRLRGERRFDGRDALIEAIENDVRAARSLFR